ncbi:hypothetical protein FGK63_05860 [Ruegeria sediminis]|uniref:Lipoprotein n=1 Tax=Ruegeria sediminis TaxID=2583820 RepID=A0ABY2X083_9RHOB|nr:hypothetical protein [Ruegeria sediminis]TMV08646.1 hypothetical protein FGK63_05860 [Ruegeria sediminis]
MKTVIRTTLLALCLGSCGPLSLYYQEGASVSRMQAETTDCQVKALRDAPVANQVRQTAPIYYPGRTICNNAGQCYTTPGWWDPGRIYSVDVNQSLRNQVEAQCMAAKGFRPVSLPPCKQNVKSRVPAQRTTKLPPLSGGSCYVRFDDGTFQIITP